MVNTANICNDLKSLLRERENPERMEFVRDAISLRYRDVKCVASRVLGEWGSEDAKKLLKSTLFESYDKKDNYQLRGVVVKSLVKCLNEDDAEWLLNEYFEVSGILSKHELLPAVISLPPESARKRLVVESKSRDRDNRQAAMKAIAHIGFHDYHELLSIFIKDDDKDIKEAANYLIENKVMVQVEK